MIETISDFKTRFQEALDDNNYKAADIAEKLDISRSTVSQWANGKTKPKRDRLLQVANLLSVNPSWLLGLDVPKKINREIIDANPVLRAALKHVSDSSFFDEVYTKKYRDSLLTKQGIRLIEAYDNAPSAIQEAVCKLLDIKKEDDNGKD